MDFPNYRKEGEFYYCDLLEINSEDYSKVDKDVHDNYEKLHTLILTCCNRDFVKNNLHYYDLGRFYVSIGMSECFIVNDGIVVLKMFEFIKKYILASEIAKEYKKDYQNIRFLLI